MGIETLLIGTITSFFSTTLGLGTVFGTIAAAIAVTSVYLGASYLLQSMQKKPKSSDQQQTVKQAVVERSRTYGRDKVGGAIAFYETRAGALYSVIIHGEGPIDAIEQCWLSDKQGAADMSAGSGLSPWGDKIRVTSYIGWTTQAASSVLTDAFGGVWTSSHRLAGLAYSVMVCAQVKSKDFQKYFPNGVPQLRVVERGALVFDLRTFVTAWSDNPALCIRDYLIHPRGLRIPEALVDGASFAAFANICDQAVALAAGGTERRYTLSYTYKLTKEPRAVLADLLANCDAELYPTATGTIGIRGGIWQAPTETLTPDDLVDGGSAVYSFKTGSGVNAEFNRLRVMFKNPATDYQPTEVSPWNDTAAQAIVGVAEREFDGQTVTSFSQARRLAKIFMARQNPKFRMAATLRYSAAIRLWGERMVAVTIPELMLDNEPFLIGSIALSPATMTGQVELSHLPAEAYAWSTAEEGTPPVEPPNTVEASVAPVPTGAVGTIEWTYVSSGVKAGRLVITVDALMASSGATYQTVGQYRTGTGAWVDMAEDGAWRVISGFVSDGLSYQLRVAHSYGGGSTSPSLSAWVDLPDIVMLADPNAPTTASQGDFAASANGSSVYLSWTTPNIANLTEARIYRGVITGFGNAVLINTKFIAANQFIQADDVPGPGTFYYYIRVFNGSGLGSSPEGPQTVTL